MKRQKTRRKFTKEFKEDAARLALADGRSTSEVAEKLGVERSCVDRWKRQYLEQLGAQGSVPGTQNPMTAVEMASEIRELRKQLRDSELQREILKKAVAIFSRD